MPHVFLKVIYICIFLLPYKINRVILFTKKIPSNQQYLINVWYKNTTPESVKSFLLYLFLISISGITTHPSIQVRIPSFSQLPIYPINTHPNHFTSTSTYHASISLPYHPHSPLPSSNLGAFEGMDHAHLCISRSKRWWKEGPSPLCWPSRVWEAGLLQTPARWVWRWKMWCSEL